MIRLIKEIVYTMKENGVAIDKTIKSEPFETDPADEERLVSNGYAERVAVETSSANEATEKAPFKKPKKKK